MRTRTRTGLAGVVLAAALMGGAAWATIPGTDGTIQGCYTTGNGNLRVVASADDCRNSETAISWSKQGPAGPAGRDGQDGAPGAPGAKGDPGTNGLDGAKGDKGDPGERGVPGANGVDGRDGAAGPAGSPGPAGAACLPTNPACVGPQGVAGPQGPQGPQGPKGDTGAQGPPGAAMGTAKLWAKIGTTALNGGSIGVFNAGGTVNVSSLTATRLRVGSYRITFPFSLEFCAVVVTDSGGQDGWDTGAWEEGGIRTLRYGYSYINGATNTASLDVQVRSHANSTSALVDGAWLNIAVFC